MSNMQRDGGRGKIIVVFGFVAILIAVACLLPWGDARPSVRDGQVSDASVAHYNDPAAVGLTSEAAASAATPTDELPSRDSSHAGSQKETPGAPASELQSRHGSIFKRDIAKLFAFAPARVTEESLIRHVDLNLVDAPVSAIQRRALNEILERNRAIIHALGDEYAQRRHTILRELDRDGQLAELTLDALAPEVREKVLASARFSSGRFLEHVKRLRAADPSVPIQDSSEAAQRRTAVLDALRAHAKEIVPGASAFLVHAGRVFVAKGEQMSALASLEEETRAAKRLFLHEVLAWFVVEGFSIANHATKIVDKFEHWILKV